MALFRNQPCGQAGFFRTHWKNILAFVLFELIFTAITAPLIIFYGPFSNMKSVAVGSLSTTYSHGYMVEFFLSRQAIERINGDDGYYLQAIQETPAEIKELDFKPRRTGKIEWLKVDCSDLKGNLLIIHDPTRIRVGYSINIPIMGETTSSIAKRNDAVAAINAGGFTYDESWSSTGGKFEGFIIHEGKVAGNNLESEDTPYDSIGFTEKGQLIFGKYSINQLRRNGVGEAISFFGPQLIVQGKRIFSPGETGGYGIAPRTAIGQRATGEILFLVVDGRNVFGSLGASMYDLQEILLANGAVNAINLDGGSSSTMYYNGKLINKPSNSMGERAIPSVFMVLPEKEADPQ